MSGEENEQDAVMRIGKRCFVGNLAWKTSWQDLKDKFRSVGDVVFANVMRDDTGRSKGWGIVEFDTPEHAVEAVKTLNGQELAGRKLLVREDREDRDVKQFNKENGIEGPAPARPPRRTPRRPPPAGGSAGAGAGGGAGAGAGAASAAPSGGERSEGGGKTSGLQVVVQGIPWKYEWKDLKDLFQEHNPVFAEVVTSKDGRSRGYGTVRFETAQAAQAAISEFHGSELEGRTLTVKLDKFAQ